MGKLGWFVATCAVAVVADGSLTASQPPEERLVAARAVVPEVLVEFAKSDEHPRNSEGDVIRLRDA